jgi:hypothetical protein
MARLTAPAVLNFRQALLETYAVNGRMNQALLEHLDPGAWRPKPPGARDVPSLRASLASTTSAASG